MGMVVLTIYDISSNKLRLKVEQLCREYGMRRVQLSAFRGRMKRKSVDKLYGELNNLYTKNDCEDTFDVQIYPIPAGIYKCHSVTENCNIENDNNDIEVIVL